ncbi:unnamed protein product [Rodentolepis nana]|uniref:RT_RNaseH domain-containing protein n=1 Tax=Rodentolepis nana TaxID=102285 RepID=A0A0R3TTQ9_RODNA|nr:unnamed protein product [Rodentolepis nana]
MHGNIEYSFSALGGIEAELAFAVEKQTLSRATTLNLIDISSATCIALKTGGSQVSVGTFSQQMVDGKIQPITFLSKKPTSTEIRYSTFDRELFNTYLAVKHFQRILEAKQFTIFTDYKPLIYAIWVPTDHHSLQGNLSFGLCPLNHTAGRFSTIYMGFRSQTFA